MYDKFYLTKPKQILVASYSKSPPFFFVPLSGGKMNYGFQHGQTINEVPLTDRLIRSQSALLSGIQRMFPEEYERTGEQTRTGNMVAIRIQNLSPDAKGRIVKYLTKRAAPKLPSDSEIVLTDTDVIMILHDRPNNASRKHGLFVMLFFVLIALAAYVLFTGKWDTITDCFS